MCPCRGICQNSSLFNQSESISCVCYERTRLNTEARKLRQSITDRRYIEKLLECMRSFYLCNANTHCWNIEADRDIRVSARGLILWLHTQPGDGFGCQLHQWIWLNSDGGIIRNLPFCP